MSSRVVKRLSGFALSRYQFWDIDLFINCTLVYGTLTVSIVAFYVLVVVGLGTLLQAQCNLGIALEALTNVVRHAHACRCDIKSLGRKEEMGTPHTPSGGLRGPLNPRVCDHSSTGFDVTSGSPWMMGVACPHRGTWELA